MGGNAQCESGRVTSFDRVVGLGTVDLPDGQIFGFHATAIADGSRTIGIGADVDVALTPASNGGWEAVRVALRSPSFVCAVCHHAVPGEIATYEICPCCGWEDDPVQSLDPSYAGGANGSSLDEARARWLQQE